VNDKWLCSASQFNDEQGVKQTIYVGLGVLQTKASHNRYDEDEPNVWRASYLSASEPAKL